MQPKTVELIARFESLTLFHSAGVSFADPDVIPASDWDAAATSFLESQEHDQDAKNRLHMALPEPEYHEWNDRVQAVRAASRPLVRRKLEDVARVGNCQRLFERIELEGLASWVGSRVTIACIEQEFAHVVEPGYFTYLAEWYLRGHFPCSWHGEPGNMKLMVY